MSDSDSRKVHLFKPEETANTRRTLREQLGELKVKCAASLCILLVLLIEVVVRRIEQTVAKHTYGYLNATSSNQP